MIAVLQRASEGKVTVDNRVTGEISKGLVILLGVAKGDNEKDKKTRCMCGVCGAEYIGYYPGDI